MTTFCEFWDALAPHHSKIENSYLDLPSLRRIVNDIHPPVLVVGAGQGQNLIEAGKRHLVAEDFDKLAEVNARLHSLLSQKEKDAPEMQSFTGISG